MKRHLVIPDCQVKPGNTVEHLGWAGKYAVATKPDVIVVIGDWWDMPSLSSYDVGKKSFEGRRYAEDVKAGNIAMDAFLEPILKERQRLREQKRKRWNPRLIFTMGNHEERINRAVENDPKLEGLMSFADLNLGRFEVYDYLEPVILDGIAYCHYFTSGVMGRPVASARALLQKKHMSCVMGHVQDRDIAFTKNAAGTRMTGLFAGIFYQHEEEYLNAQTNGSWAGLWTFNEVQDGSFDELPVSMSYLRRKYGKNI
tara:strand:- start:339 stop:1106 length:768 start_codon:yes stop_codon:yes gene_type:complete